MGKSALPCSGQNAPPEQGSGEGILWSSILVTYSTWPELWTTDWFLACFTLCIPCLLCP